MSVDEAINIWLKRINETIAMNLILKVMANFVSQYNALLVVKEVVFDEYRLSFFVIFLIYNFITYYRDKLYFENDIDGVRRKYGLNKSYEI